MKGEDQPDDVVGTLVLHPVTGAGNEVHRHVGARGLDARGARLVQSFSYAEPVRAASTALLERGGGGADGGRGR